MDRPLVDWRVPSEEWNTFLSYVETKHGKTEGQVGREVERAMREWIDDDEFARVEEKVDHLVQAAGRTPEELEEKTLASAPPDSREGETTRVQCRVDAALKDEFAAHVKQETDDRVGVGLARALRARRNGGRARRVEEKLDRVGDDAAELLAELVPGDAGSPPLTQKRTIVICQRLGPQFSEDELEQAIAKVAGDSSPTIRNYTTKVLDHRDCVPHPNQPDVFIPREQAEEYADSAGIDLDAPAYERLPYDELSKAEKVHGLRIDLARRSVRNNGRWRLDANGVRNEVFSGHPSDSHSRQLMELAADANGFTVVRAYDKKQLQVNLRNVTDEEVLESLRKAANNRRESNQKEESSGTSDDGVFGDVEARGGAARSTPPVTDEGGRGP